MPAITRRKDSVPDSFVISSDDNWEMESELQAKLFQPTRSRFRPLTREISTVQGVDEICRKDWADYHEGDGREDYDDIHGQPTKPAVRVEEELCYGGGATIGTVYCQRYVSEETEGR